MGPGLVGVPGQAPVNQLAENPEAEVAAIHIPCLVERIVLGRKKRSYCLNLRLLQLQRAAI